MGVTVPHYSPTVQCYVDMMSHRARGDPVFRSVCLPLQTPTPSEQEAGLTCCALCKNAIVMSFRRSTAGP